MASTFPNWKEGTDYRAKRDADLAQSVAKGGSRPTSR
jgi:hypothetical protein